MLDTYIIEEILKKEKKQKQNNSLTLEISIDDKSPPPLPQKKENAIIQI